jgi:hypothetical protein
LIPDGTCIITALPEKSQTKKEIRAGIEKEIT